MPNENDDLWNEAMALLLRLQAAPSDPKAREEILRFCAESEAHLAAWESAKRLYRLTGEATGAPAREKARRRRELTRRGVIGGLGAIAVGSAAVKGPDLWRRWQSDMVSDSGNIAEHRLADGTRLTLGPDSAVRIVFSQGLRRIDLLDGMALFDLAEDGRRPFEARAGDFVARAGTATSFEMRRNSSSSLVGVSRGSVAVDKGGTIGLGELGPGEWVSGGPDDSAPRRGRRDATQVAAWRDRKLIAEEERIDAVAAEIARWQSTRIVIADWNLGASRISGLFDLSDPVSALQAVVSPYGGRVRRLTPWLTVLSSV